MNNEAIGQFEDYLNSVFVEFASVKGHALEALLAVKLYAESNKRRMNEGCEGLADDAAKSLVADFRDGFNEYRHARGISFYWRDSDYEQLAEGIAEQVKRAKPVVEQWMRETRAELFNEDLYKRYLSASYAIDEHPMQTFIYWLDYIEQMKGLPDYRNWLGLKRSLVNLIRVGSAALPRSEWQNTLCKVEA